MIQKKFKISYVIMIIFIITLSTLSYGLPSDAARTSQENNAVSNEVITNKNNTSDDSTSTKEVTTDDVFLTRCNS